MDAAVAAIVGAAVGGLIGAGGAYGAAQLQARTQAQARLEELVGDVSGLLLRRADDFDRPGWEFYARCLELERNPRASQRQRTAARRASVIGKGVTPDEIRQLAEDLGRSD